MEIGKKLYELRKNKNLSQEEVAEILKVSRQTISKWETEQSTPDLDKIVPICELYEITIDELLTGKKVEKKEENNINNLDNNQRKRAKGISKGIFLYFVAVAWIMTSIPVFMLNPIIASAVFILICARATYKIIYSCMAYKKEIAEENNENVIAKQIIDIFGIIVFVFYLLLSFSTGAWYITWIVWVIYGIIQKIIKLIFMLGEK